MLKVLLLAYTVHASRKLGQRTTIKRKEHSASPRRYEPLEEAKSKAMRDSSLQSNGLFPTVKSFPRDESVRRNLQDTACEEDKLYVIEASYDTRNGQHDGAYYRPIEVVPGCSFQVEMAPGKSFYMQLSGFQARNDDGNRPQLHYNWFIENEETPITMFSFRNQPTNNEADLGTGYDWYYWPTLTDNALTVREDTTGNDIDYYHCYQFCGYEPDLESSCAVCGNTDLRRQYDTLYMTLTNFPESTETTRATLTFDLVYNHNFIREEELQVIRDIFIDLCLPYNQVPRDFEWETFQEIGSEEIRGEQDPRRKPYCDWLPTVELEEIEALTETDCLVIPGITCSEEGHVSEIVLPEMGLRGELPDSLEKLTHLVYLELGNNRLSGSLPEHLFASSKLLNIDLDNNFIEGTIPCPEEPSPLKSLLLAGNMLSGELHGCLFEKLPELRTLDLSQNNFESALPAEIAAATSLSALYLERSGIIGTLEHLTSLPMLTKVDLSHNFIQGSISSDFFEALPRLYRVDLSWNELDQELPSFANARNLRRVDLSHNKFSGEMNQFVEFAAQQIRGVQSSLDLSMNSFCGELPEVFYDVLMDSNYHLTSFDVAGNHFRCSKENGNTYFAQWAMALRHDFGKCVSVPEMTSLESTAVVMDPNVIVLVYVNGIFTPTTEGTCKFHFSDRSEAVVPAVFESSTRVACALPDIAPFGETSVTIASYCDDYASPDTLNGFVPMSFEIIEQTPASSSEATSSSKKSKTNKSAIIGGSIAAVVAMLLLICVCFILCRESQGKPILGPNKGTLNPIYSTKQMNDVMPQYEEDIQLEVFEDESKKQVDDEGHVL